MPRVDLRVLGLVVILSVFALQAVDEPDSTSRARFEGTCYGARTSLRNPWKKTPRVADSWAAARAAFQKSAVLVSLQHASSSCFAETFYELDDRLRGCVHSQQHPTLLQRLLAISGRFNQA